jgi:hypothetical protein
MTREQDVTPTLLVSDSKGRITHVTSKLAGRLGTTVSKMHVRVSAQGAQELSMELLTGGPGFQSQSDFMAMRNGAHATDCSPNECGVCRRATQCMHWTWSCRPPSRASTTRCVQ